MTPFTHEAGGRELRARRKGLEGWSGKAGGYLCDQRLSNRQRRGDLRPQMDSSRARGPVTWKVQDERAVPLLSPPACRMWGGPERGLPGYVGSGTLIIHRDMEANDLIFPDRQTPTSVFWA